MGTRTRFASSYWVTPRGFKNSSTNTSPGESRTVILPKWNRLSQKEVVPAAFRISVGPDGRFGSNSRVDRARTAFLKRPKVTAVVDVEIRLSARWRALP